MEVASIVVIFLFCLMGVVLARYIVTQPDNIRCSQKTVEMWKNIEFISTIIFLICIVQMLNGWSEGVLNEIPGPATILSIIIFLFAHQVEAECKGKRKKR